MGKEHLGRRVLIRGVEPGRTHKGRVVGVVEYPHGPHYHVHEEVTGIVWDCSELDIIGGLLEE